MADLSKTVQIIFGATDKTGTIISGVQSRLDSLSSPVADLTKKFLLFEAALLAVGVAFATKAFKESVAFEGALLDLQKVLTDSEGDAAQFTGTVDELSNRYGEAATSILQGAANFKQAGFTAKESFELQKSALDLVIAGDLDAARASDLLVASLKGFKAPASEATRLTDILNEVSNKYATNLEQLGIGMADLSPIASLMGFSFEETAGVLTPVIEVFRSGSEAAIALKTGLLRLVADQKPVQEALQSIGVNQRDANGQLRSGKDILIDVAKAFTTLDENQKVFVASQLVSIQQAGRMVEVFNGLEKSTAVTNDALHSAGSITKEVEIRLGAAEKQIDRARVAFNNMSRSIGDQFRPELAGLFGGISNIEIALQKVAESGGFEPLFNVIRPQLRQWQETLAGIARALPAAFSQINYGPIIDALDRVGISFGRLFEGLDLTDPEDLARIFNRLVDIGGTMIDVTRGMAEIFGKVGIAVGKLVEWFTELDPSTQKIIGSIGGAAVAFQLFSPAITATGVAITALLPKISTLSGAGGIGALTTALGKGGLVGAAGGAGFALGTLIEKTTGIGEKIGGFFGDLIFKNEELGKAVIEAEIDAYTAQQKLNNAIEEGTELEKKSVDTASERIDSFSKETKAIEKVNNAIGERSKSIEKAVEVEKKLATEIDFTRGDTSALAALPGENTQVERRRLDAQLAAQKVVEETTKSFESLTPTIEATSKTIAELSKAFVETPSPSSRKFLQEEIKKTTQSQNDLTDAQTKFLNARTKQLEKGEALINITADGLEPEIEAFMWQILERIQIRANADGAEYLLGI